MDSLVIAFVLVILIFIVIGRCADPISKDCPYKKLEKFTLPGLHSTTRFIKQSQKESLEVVSRLPAVKPVKNITSAVGLVVSTEDNEVPLESMFDPITLKSDYLGETPLPEKKRIAKPDTQNPDNTTITVVPVYKKVIGQPVKARYVTIERERKSNNGLHSIEISDVKIFDGNLDILKDIGYDKLKEPVMSQLSRGVEGVRAVPIFATNEYQYGGSHRFYGANNNKTNHYISKNYYYVYWEIDLQEMRDITTLQVTARQDCCWDRLDGVVAVFYDDEREKVLRVPLRGVKDIQEFNLIPMG